MDCGNSSFCITIESRVTGTGPVCSTVSAVELELTFNGCCFGKLRLPEVKTSLWGTKVAIREQKLQILDMAVFKAYMRSVIINNDTCFQLENGECTIRSFGVVAHCSYCLDIPTPGMMGPKATLQKVCRDGCDTTLTLKFHNPSPVELDHGTTIFELRNCKGESLAEFRGALDIVRGDFDVVLRGRLKSGATASRELRLVGVGVDSDTWCKETAGYFEVALEIRPELVHLLEN